ncbi:MAG TPA: sigma-54-dependent Fis family transcriptional regulator, partial [Croceibacterium sp.]|nr:sigma-54-dependent Fis family transcriptional regulator [Croceibacterium sp.]
MTAADFSAQQPTILLISPPAADADLVIDRARVAGWRTIVVPELSQANATLESLAGVSAIVLNENASGPATADAVAELRKFNPKTPLVVITDEASSKSPIQIIRAGATDYLRRPVEP